MRANVSRLVFAYNDVLFFRKGDPSDCEDLCPSSRITCPPRAVTPASVAVIAVKTNPIQLSFNVVIRAYKQRSCLFVI